MPGYQVQVSLANVNSKSEDRVVNTWALRNVDALTEVQLIDIAEAFMDFYDQAPGGEASSLMAFYSSTIIRDADFCTIKIYNLDEDSDLEDEQPIGSPDLTMDWGPNTPALSNQALPNEVAMVLSLEAFGHDAAPVEVGATRPRSRRKGRIYLGPFNVNALAPGVTGVEARPATALISRTLAALGDLRDAVQAVEASADLGVWSRTDKTVRTLVAASVDNSFDIIRSRSIDATARTRVLL